ncbi:MAG TPA: MCP four helix bundle domain-containing protein, partial [Geothrix sp.]
MLTNLKIGTRLAVGFGLILALLLAVAGIGLNRMGTIGENTREIVEHYNMQERLAYDMAEQQHIVSRLMRTVILEADSAEKRKYDDKLEETRKLYDEAGTKLLGTLKSEEGKALFATIKASLDKVRPSNTKVLDLSMKAGRDKEAALVLIEEVQPLASALQKDIDNLVLFLKKATGQRYEEAKVAQSQANMFMTGISVLALITGIVLAFFITRSITTPLKAVGAVIETVAQGDLTQRVEIHSKDELGELGRILNTTNEGLREMVLQIQEAALAISSASGEISVGNTDLSRRTEEQAASLEETASSMEQITSNVNQTADNARSAN